MEHQKPASQSAPQISVAQTVLSDNARSEIQLTALLGYGGALPFVFLAMATLLDLVLPFAPARALLIGYGVVILTFLGALHWGDQIQQKTKQSWRYIWSVMPALLGWVAFMMPAAIASMMLIAGFLVCWLIDRQLVNKGVWPIWLGRLRLHLTVIACFSLACVFVPPGLLG